MSRSLFHHHSVQNIVKRASIALGGKIIFKKELEGLGESLT